MVRHWQFPEPLFGIGQNFELTLANFLCFWAIFSCCKWPKIKDNLTVWSHGLYKVFTRLASRYSSKGSIAQLVGNTKYLQTNSLHMQEMHINAILQTKYLVVPGLWVKADVGKADCTHKCHLFLSTNHCIVS